MCGISGIYVQNGESPDLALVRRMGKLMTHRGPDNFGSSVLGKTAMSHNRLSLLDLSDAANQPFGNDDFILSYNGEIYNFREIRRELEAEFGIKFVTTSDTEVLYHSLIRHGVDKCLRKIRGMFAFSFYDRAADTLFLARDRLGIKPLYYHENGGRLYWASEIKAISTALDLSPDPIRTLLSVNNTAEKSNEFTLFKGLLSVAPGSYLMVRGGAMESTDYYDVVDEFDIGLYTDLSNRNRAEVVEEFDKLFSESVERMLISDVPVGAFVSGGIDSSLASAIATRTAPDLKLFSANVVGKYSEFGNAQTLAEYLGCDIFEYRFEPQMMLRDWVSATYHYDCPIVIHVNAIPFSSVATLARDSGVKAVLTGEGADELFLGYPKLLASRYEKAIKLPYDLVKKAYSLSPTMYQFLFPERNSLPIFANQLVQGFEMPQLEERASRAFERLGDRERKEQALTVRMLREHLVTLLHRNDRMGMMASIEARFPFLDEPIVKFAINLPAKFKIGLSHRFHNYKHPFLTDKWVIRKLAEKYLPSTLVNKRKNGFPMFGHKFLRVKSGFFEDGWVADSLGLRQKDLEYLIETQEPYLVAKLASVEIFGRIFAMKTNFDCLNRHVRENSEIVT